MRNFDVVEYRKLNPSTAKPLTNKDSLRAKIRSDVESFLALDGVIEPIQQGVSSYVNKNRKQLRDGRKKK